MLLSSRTRPLSGATRGRAPSPTCLFSTALMLLLAGPSNLRAQTIWTGIGSISGTVMYMDTTTLVREGSIRKVWIKSFDLDPRSVMIGTDTLTFDTVIGLNIFDCKARTRVVGAVRYLLGQDVVLDVGQSRDGPEPLRPKSFFAAVFADVCKGYR